MVYNCCSGTANPITFDQLQHCLNPFLARHPSKSAVRSPHLSFTTNKTKHAIHGFFAESVPVYFAEGINRLIGKKTK